MAKLIAGFLLLLARVPDVYPKFQIYDEWSTVDYEYDDQKKSNDLQSGKFRPDEVVIYDSQLYYRGSEEKLFVTTPDLFGAAPFSLSTVAEKRSTNGGGNMLVPYPDASWYGGDCNSSITSVFRVKIDKLDRLWVLDSGMVNQLTSNSKLACPPQILIFDLKNNNALIRKYQVPDNQHYDDSLLVNIELDVRNQDGSDTMAYISDVTGYRMLVYSLKTDSSYPIDNPYFNPFPIYCFFRNINGKNFTLLNGLYSITLGAGQSPNRQVYFHSLSSAREGMISLEVLNNPQLAKNAFNYDISDVRGFHSSAEVMTNTGFLIFANIEDNSIMVWDSTTSYKPENFYELAKDDVNFQFITGLQILNGNKLMVTSSRYENVLTGNIAKNQINYRVLINLDISKFLIRK